MLGVAGQKCCVRFHGALVWIVLCLKPHANGRIIVGQQLPTLMGVVASVCTKLNFDRFQTLLNNMQQGVQKDGTCNNSQH